MAFRFTPLSTNRDDLAAHSRKRPAGSPPLSPAGKRYRSVEMASVGDSMSESLSAGMLRFTLGKNFIYFVQEYRCLLQLRGLICRFLAFLQL